MVSSQNMYVEPDYLVFYVCVSGYGDNGLWHFLFYAYHSKNDGIFGIVLLTMIFSSYQFI
jgi:hypothetical protein